MLPLQLLTQTCSMTSRSSRFRSIGSTRNICKKPGVEDRRHPAFMLFFDGQLGLSITPTSDDVLCIKAHTPAQQSLFQTAWFVEGLLSQTLIVHIDRTEDPSSEQPSCRWR